MSAKHSSRRPRRDLSDLIGQKFGILTVVAFAGHKDNQYLWECRCDCGATCIRPGPRIASNHRKTVSCGCRKGGYIHGGKRTKIHKIWCLMRDRCGRETHENYAHYGGRGITVCEEWKASFEAFRDWAIVNGYRDGLTIERKDVNGNYEPDNCRWATRLEQGRNKRDSRRVTAFGETKCLADWIDDPRCAANYTLVLYRLNAGWDAEKAISAPPRPMRRKPT